VPTPVTGSLGQDSEQVTALSCGWRHNLAVTRGGNVYSWGRGGTGQLGLGDSQYL